MARICRRVLPLLWALRERDRGKRVSLSRLFLFQASSLKTAPLLNRSNSTADDAVCNNFVKRRDDYIPGMSPSPFVASVNNLAAGEKVIRFDGAVRLTVPDTYQIRGKAAPKAVFSWLIKGETRDLLQHHIRTASCIFLLSLHQHCTHVLGDKLLGN